MEAFELIHEQEPESVSALVLENRNKKLLELNKKLLFNDDDRKELRSFLSYLELILIKDLSLSEGFRTKRLNLLIELSKQCKEAQKETLSADFQDKLKRTLIIFETLEFNQESDTRWKGLLSNALFIDKIMNLLEILITNFAEERNGETLTRFNFKHKDLFILNIENLIFK